MTPEINHDPLFLNDLLTCISRTELSGIQFRVMIALVRVTYGHNKRFDWVCGDQVKELMMYSGAVTKIHASIRLLVSRNILIKKGKKIGLNYELSTWKRCSERVTRDIGISEGFIYLLSNPSLIDTYKIGLTQTKPERRLNQLSKSTSIPTGFKMEGFWHTENVFKTERDIQNHLDRYRVNQQREFFLGDLGFFKGVIEDFTK